MEFEWKGTIDGLRPASKKNSKEIIKRGGKVYLVPSAAYKKFNKEALKQLKDLKPETPYDKTVILEAEVYMKGKLRQDYDNFAGSIGDTLQDAGIIADDDLIDEAHIYKHRGAKDWRIEIHLVSFE